VHFCNKKPNLHPENITKYLVLLVFYIDYVLVQSYKGRRLKKIGGKK